MFCKSNYIILSLLAGWFGLINPNTRVFLLTLSLKSQIVNAYSKHLS